MKTYLYTKIILLILITSLSIEANAQTQNLEQKPWSFNFNFGQTLFWGDVNNDIINPFNAYFQSDKSAFGYGLIIQKNFNSWLGVDFQYLGGQLKGTRYTWSNEAPANLYFNSNIHQLGLNIDIDIFDIVMQPQATRLFNFYIRGGGAYTLFDAKEYNLITNNLIQNSKGGGLSVTGGWGIRFDVSKKVGLTFENIFTYSFSDLLDAHSSVYSQANDLFAYTSVGATYRIYPKPKQAKIKEQTEENQIELAENNEDQNEIIEEEKKELTMKIIMPSTIKSTDSTIIKIEILKYDLNEAAKLQQTLPFGFIAKEINNNNSEFSFSDQIISFKWEKFPEDKEKIEVSYMLISKNLEAKSYTIPGILFFTENGKETITQFKETINVEKAKVPEIAKVEQKIENIKTETSPVKTETKINNQEQIDGLEYRVQVKAIYGGKSSPEAIARDYNISEPISEDFGNGYSKYTAGHFSSYEEARAYRDELRSKKVPGAFVVAYYNGKRVNNISDAINMQGTQVPTNTQTTPSSIKNEGLTFSIQIAASSRELSANSLKNQFGIEQNVITTTHNGLYKYLVGSYEDYNQANLELKKIKNKVPDAFIVKFTNGVR